MQVDHFGAADAFRANGAREYERNRERYVFLRWGQRSLQNFRVVPPETGICHQVNLEYLAQVVFTPRPRTAPASRSPTPCVGTDSHTTMINGLGVMGWGVGGIEAEAVMLGQPYYMLTPQVVGVKLTGELPPGATATDLVLTVTQLLRKHGVVDKFVEFYGPALAQLPLADRATIANMSPEYGATMGFFPVDDADARVSAPERPLAGAGRAGRSVLQGRRGSSAPPRRPIPQFSDAGQPRPLHRRAQPRRAEAAAGPRAARDDEGGLPRGAEQRLQARLDDADEPPSGCGDAPSARPLQRTPSRAEQRRRLRLTHGAVVIAAITSCTNTSNPSVMLGAGILAKKAVERGLTVKPWVKTSLAPGSKVVTDYLRNAGLLPALEALRFNRRRLRLHDLHRQQRSAAGAGRRRRSRSTTSSPRRC